MSNAPLPSISVTELCVKRMDIIQKKRKKLLEGATFFELLFIMTALRYARHLDYSAAIAPVGHGSSQAPQSMQVSGSTTYFVGPSEIASTGHTAAHAPQLTHSSLTTCAIMVPPF